MAIPSPVVDAAAQGDFHPNRFPLDPGLRLLEASAGTGKTFALAHLVLRLVTEEAIPLRRLLVVTFTDAAAAELRERIGRRLQETLRGLEDPGREPPDAVLGEWLTQQGAGTCASTLGILKMRLLLALEELDGADITTIHGFCQRSLQRHALEAGRPPGLTLDAEQVTLREQVVHSYWQGEVLQLPLPLLRGLQRKHMKPKELGQLLSTLDGDPGLELDPLPADLPVDGSLAAVLPALHQRHWDRVRKEWQCRGRDLLETLFQQAREWKAAGLPYTPYVLKPTGKWNAERMDAFFSPEGHEGEPPPYDRILEEGMVRDFLHPGAFCKAVRKAEGTGEKPIVLPHRPLMEAVADLVDGPAELALLHACHWMRRELARRREHLGLCSYSDLLRGLDPGPGATAPTPLLEAVAGRYSAALIDEFQDTDPIQWRILRQAFGRGGHLLVMVGDPKQAIYGFRGGDLATYLAARAAAGSCYRMRENRRSTPELISALNQLLGERGLPRSGVAMPRLESRAQRGGDGEIPIELLWLGQSPTLPPSTVVERQVPALVAAHITQLLHDPPSLREGSRERPLEADDICVLVSKHRQAEKLRLAMQGVGIATRLVSHADVFHTPAAGGLQRLLDALADPTDANRLRLLAASPLLAWSGEAIRNAPPQRWSDLAVRLQGMAQAWPAEGLLGPLAHVLGAEQMARLSTSGRFLADLQQVAELLQERLHRERLGPHSAARWLRRRRQQEVTSVPEAEQIHSDKVRQAVSVVTVHRSKGLEYPLVICPYFWMDAGKGQARGLGRRWHPEGEAAPRLDLHRNRDWGTGQQADRADRLALEAEQERLAYVALTRAMHRLVLAWVPASGRECNPLYPWLFCQDPLPALDEGWPHAAGCGEWRQRLHEEIQRRGLPLRLVDPASEVVRPVSAAGKTEGSIPLAAGPVPQRPLRRGWARSSYTSWTQHRPGGGGGDAREQGPQEEGRDVRDPAGATAEPRGGESGERGTPPWPERGLWADLPGGAGFGDCVHRLLEGMDYTAAHPINHGLRSLASQELRRAGLQETVADPLLEAIQQMVQTPFGGELGRLRPADLPPVRRLNELHFDLSLRQGSAATLAQAFLDHPGGAFGPRYAASLANLPIHHSGFLTGSIDLVFPAPGKRRNEETWWVLDWKTNWLGQRDPQGRGHRCGPLDYGEGALVTLMESHHYPLQAHLYLVALHRYLQWRLPGYSPAQHLGGYVYVFVRGTPGEAGRAVLPGAVPGMLVERPPLGRLLALDGALGIAPAGWQPGALP